MSNEKTLKTTVAAVLCITLWQTTLAAILNIEEKNYALTTKKSEFLSVHFDASFYKALFLLNKTNTEMVILDFDKLQSTNHQVPIKKDFLFIGLMNNGNVLLGSKTEVLLISKQDGYSAFNLTVPTEFFRNNRVSEFVHFNDYNQTMLFVFNDSKIGEIDARIPIEAKINVLPESWIVTQSPAKIKDMLYIQYGRKIAVLAEQSSLERGYVFQQNIRQLMRKLPDEIDDCVRYSYNAENNLLTAFKSGPNTLLHFDCDSFAMKPSTSTSGSGLSFNAIKNVYSPLGTSILIATTNNEVFFFDLAQKKFIEKVAFPAAVDVFWAEGTSYFVLQQTQGDDEFKFKIFRMTSADSRFCHKSCGGKCDEIFKPCYNMLKILLSMLLGLVLSVALIFVIIWMFRTFKGSDDELMDDMGNAYEMTEGGELRQKRLTISLEEHEASGRITELPDLPKQGERPTGSLQPAKIDPVPEPVKVDDEGSKEAPKEA